ncbi:3-ketoacyl-ACP reductase [Klebsormidium nitens]|uniref:3-ketoacyl-ACP reductase n=1 Tax=Klebsormidium nitens TaxID=105231 RepID=A0A1Y1INL0_KLENI|nr:3-ketoacyl-ACP reductase [Klebsormidium nitens]|eukprot:GAQ92253.1 3-ketoacyl-ACP reductase [Klebsormidium nitens]
MAPPSYSDLFSIEGKTALVTGASSGIGSRFSVFLASQGASVVVAARRKDKLHDVVQEIEKAGGKAKAVELDVSANQESIKRSVDEAWAAFGKLDILVNNAGLGGGEGVLKDSQETFDALFNTNVRGVYFTTQAVARLMVDHDLSGRIVNTSSIAGAEMVMAGWAIYAASKAAVIQLTRAMAVELAPKGINVNSIAPGVFPSELTSSVVGTESAKLVQRAVPARRYGDTETDLMGALLLLVSEKASRYIVGVTIPVDGGHSLYTMDLANPTAIFDE